jgi:ATP-dependent DNA ligase
LTRRSRTYVAQSGSAVHCQRQIAQRNNAKDVTVLHNRKPPYRPFSHQLDRIRCVLMDMRDPTAALPANVRSFARKRARPNWISPMLATLVAKPFSDDDWIFETKLDGIRCITIHDGYSLQLFSRNRKELNNTYPELIEPLVSQPVQGYIVDGEIVAFKGAVTSFSQLQQRMQIRNPDEAGVASRSSITFLTCFT